MINSFYSICIACILGSCIPGKSQKSADKQNYKEDLSAVRPKYTKVTNMDEKPNPINNTKPGIPQKDITRQLQVKLDTLAARNKKMKLAQGFRVMVYSGNSSEEMKKVKLKLRSLLGDEMVYDEYKQPTFRVKAGDCYSRLEAYYVLNRVIREFPNAIVVPDQINIDTDK